MAVIRTQDGDRLDQICFAHYGYLAGTVEAVLGANPGLAAIPQPFAAGVTFTLPDLPAAPAAEVLRLWS